MELDRAAILERYPDQESCLRRIEHIRWGTKPRCPHCSSFAVRRKHEGSRVGRWNCHTCQSSFNALSGTLLSHSTVPLQKWFLAIEVMLHATEDVSSVRLGREIGVSQPTALYLMRRLRNGTAGESGLVQAIVQSDGGEVETEIRRLFGTSLPPEPYWQTSDYIDIITTGWNDDERYRAIVSELPRRFHASSRSRQAQALVDRPGLTGTNWDALLAAVVEHLATTHNHPIPDWCDEPGRFLEIPWHPDCPTHGWAFMDAWRRSPAAFIRHGALPDPSDLDSRGGERHYGPVL